MTIMLLKRLALPIGFICAVLVVISGDFVAGQGNPCGMQLNTAPVIFCDTFDQPFPVTNRSGQLNGTLWGVSRLMGQDNYWRESTIEGCNGPQPASPVGATDVIVCNGRVRQSQHDNGDVTVMALYPKQPFDFANRTGTVSFDVTNDTTGNHGAWPEFWMTDQPVPAPNSHLVPCDTCSLPRHGFGIRFAADRGSCGPNGWRADSAVIVRNYVPQDVGIFDGSTSGTRIVETGCVTLSSGPNGGLNHIELRISQNRIDVYASDAGSSSLRLINQVLDANLTMTRGLIWIGDYHYHAEKAMEPRPNQQTHTYSWDNVAFDGPATYRDLSYDVLDNTQPLGGGLIKIGWDTTPTAPANLNTLPMDAQGLATATSALLLFNFGKSVTPTTFNYTINGHANTAPNPTGSTAGFRSIALPVPLNQLVAGPNNIRLSSNIAMKIVNVNIVLVAGAPVPGNNPPNPPSNLRISSSE